MEKALVKIIFDHLFKIFVALLKTFGMQKDDKITFFSGDESEQCDMQKGSFQKML